MGMGCNVHGSYDVACWVMVAHRSKNHGPRSTVVSRGHISTSRLGASAVRSMCHAVLCNFGHCLFILRQADDVASKVNHQTTHPVGSHWV